MSIEGTTAAGIVDSVRTLARSGELAAGDVLPLVRSLSRTLGPDIRTAAVASDPATARQLRRRLAPCSRRRAPITCSAGACSKPPCRPTASATWPAAMG